MLEKIQLLHKFNKSWIYLVIIFSSSLFYRLVFLPWNLPLTSDALTFFLYSSDTLAEGHLPNTLKFANNVKKKIKDEKGKDWDGKTLPPGYKLPGGGGNE